VLAGLQIGRAVAHVVPIRADLVSGVALVVMATVMGPHA
jgi:putative Mn2+ efflux pump MntP